MEAWREGRSLLAPLLVGASIDKEPAPGFANALLAAAGSVPDATTPYAVRRPGKLRRETESRRRTLTCVIGGPSRPYSVRVRLVDVPPGSTAAAASLACRQWEVGLRLMKTGTAIPAIPDDLDVGLLELSMYQLGGEGLAGGAQLALLRHLWILTLKASDPDLIVVGGQDGWSDDWWTETQQPADPMGGTR